MRVVIDTNVLVSAALHDKDPEAVITWVKVSSAPRERVPGRGRVVDEVLSAASMRRRGLFDADGVARLVRADRGGRIDAAYTIFAVVCIEVWCRTFLDRGGPFLNQQAHNELGAKHAF
jgi:predicted nucleic acid-binding protein